MVEIKSTRLSLFDQLKLIGVASIITSFFVFVFLYAFDGSNWGFVEGPLIINIGILLLLGFTFAVIFFTRELKRGQDKTLIINQGKIEVKTTQDHRIYDVSQAFNVRVDRHFYVFSGHERLTISLKTFGVKSKTHEVFILNKGTHEQLKETVITAIKDQVKTPENPPVDSD